MQTQTEAGRLGHVHREPYLTLAAVTEMSALITWGAFFFDVTGEEMDGRFKLINDKDLKFLNPPRKTTIGESSDTYGTATLEVWEEGGGGEPVKVPVDPKPGERLNHAWVTGLKPDTTYRYRLTVMGDPWADDERRDWVVKGSKQGMILNKGRYENVFRMYPPADQPTPDFAFAVIGDYGRGVKDASTQTTRQREVAAALYRAVEEKGVRFVLTTGDNVYGGGGMDSDWFFSYYQPYRYVINRVPVYPSCGNHDTGESEGGGENEFSDDYAELLDNFYIRQRFLSDKGDEGDALKETGLFYDFNFGRDFQFVSIDTAEQESGEPRPFERTENLDFVKQIIPDAQGAAPEVWRIPFFHHPAFCYGPEHGNTQKVIDKLVPIFEKGGVRLVLSGHEHNLQMMKRNGVNYVLTGGAGEVRTGGLSPGAKNDNVAWSAPALGSVLTQAEAGFSIEFKKSKSTVYEAVGCVAPMIDDQLAVGKKVLEMYQQGNWNKDWAVITELVQARSATVLISNSSSSKIELSAGGTFTGGAASLADVNAQLQVAFSKDMMTTLVSQAGLTPLFKARGVKSNGPIGPLDKAAPFSGGLSALDFLAGGDSLRSEDLIFGEVQYDLTGEEDDAV